MIATIRREKQYHSMRGLWKTRQETADVLGLSDGSHIDRIMQGCAYIVIPRKDGKAARMYHCLDVAEKSLKRRQNAPELFDRRTIKATAKDKRKAQQDADIRTLINAKG